MSDADAVRAVFRKLDTEGTGAIDRKELTAAIHQLDPSFSEAELLKGFTAADTNNDGLIDYDEFVSWLFQETTGTPKGGPPSIRKQVCKRMVQEGKASGIDEEEEDEEEEDDDEEEEDDEEDEEPDEEDEDEEEEEDDEDESKPPSPKKKPKAAKNAAAKAKSGKINKPAESGQDAALADMRKKLAEAEAALKTQKQKADAAQKQIQELKSASTKATASGDASPLRAAATTPTPEPTPLPEVVVEEEVAAPEVTPSPVATKAKKGKAGKKKNQESVMEQEGVACVQELEMGNQQQVRSALCIGNEVWTVDWGGAVSVRSREDASQVLGTITTNKFVSCMLHMEPWLMWFGQESDGISLCDTQGKAMKGSLTGGHSSLISCLAVDDTSLGEASNGVFPRRRAWSGSDDFTIRQWHIDTWLASATKPESIPAGTDVIELGKGKYKLAIWKGQQLHGHKNKVRCMLKLGPVLWTGSDDHDIRIWNCADSMCKQVLKSAHKLGVLQLSVVRSFVWSAGGDGQIKEWSLGEAGVEVHRSFAPDGYEKGVYGLLPLGHDVWTCGHAPNINVFDQQGLEQTAKYDGHKPYVSKLIAIDRMKSTTVWSTSFKDRKIKVWKHTVQENDGNVDEMKAANRLYEHAERGHADHISDMVDKLHKKEELIRALGLGDLSEEDLAKVVGALGDIMKGLSHLSGDDMVQVLEKLGSIVKGLSHLSAEDMIKALDKVGEILGSLSHLSGPELEKVLDQVSNILKGLSDLSGEEMAKVLGQLNNLLNVLKEAGLMDILDKPEQIRDLFEALKRNGLDPRFMPGVLDAFGSTGLQRLLRRPDLLKKLLQAFTLQGMEHLIDDPDKLQAIFKIFNDLTAKDLLEGNELNKYLNGSDGDEAGQTFGAADGSIIQGQWNLVDSASPEEPCIVSFSGEEGDLAAQIYHGATCLEDAPTDGISGSCAVDGQKVVLGEQRDGSDTKTYEGTLSDDGTTISGTWSTSPGDSGVGAAGEFTMTRIDGDGESSGSGEPKLKRVLQGVQGLRNVVADYQDMLDEMGLGNLLDDPEQFRKLLETMRQLKAALDANGFGDLLKNPKGLADILAHFNGMKKAFEEHGFEELWEDPYNLKGFLRNYSKIRDAFRATGLEYLLDSSPAMREFLEKHGKDGAELSEVRDKASHLEKMEKLLLQREEALRKSQEEAAALRAELDKYKKLGTLAEVTQWKKDSMELKHSHKVQRASDGKVRDLEDRLVAHEQQRMDALEQWKYMFDRFKELDIFKLDIIAREMKGVLNKVGLIEKATKQLKDDSSKLKDYGDRQKVACDGNAMQEQCKQTAAHIHDVILKCLSEKQRMHIGVATDNEFMADNRQDGRLQEGGSMIYSIKEEADRSALMALSSITAGAVERPNYGASSAARLSRGDDIKAAPQQYRNPSPRPARG